MKRNHLIAAWLNGFDFSLKSFRGWGYEGMLSRLGGMLGKPVRRISDAYGEPVAGSYTSLAAPPALDRSAIAGKPFLRPLEELAAYVRREFRAEEIVGFYVHGSLSTLDYVENYSDFDTLVVVRRAVLDDPKWAADFRRRLSRSNAFLYLLDPLQHHFHFTISEYDLARYDESIFPLHLFGYSRELSEFRAEIPLSPVAADFDLTALLAGKRDMFQRVWPAMAPLDAYETKNAVQNIAMLPTLFLEQKFNQAYYKRDSFEAARPYFSPESWSLIDRASEVRRSCPYRSYYPYFFRKWIALGFHYKLLSQFHRRFDADNSSAVEAVMGPDYLSEAVTFLDEMESKCR